MDVQVVDSLASMLSVVDDKSITFLIEAFLFSNLCASDHQMSEKLSVGLCSFGHFAKTLTILWNDQEVSFGDWCNISECQADVILIDNCSWDLLLYNLVEKCYLFRLCSLSFFLFHNKLNSK